MSKLEEIESEIVARLREMPEFSHVTFAGEECYGALDRTAAFYVVEERSGAGGGSDLMEKTERMMFGFFADEFAFVWTCAELRKARNLARRERERHTNRRRIPK